MVKLFTNEKLSLFQIFTLIVITCFSFSTFMFDSIVNEVSGRDGWISIILVSLLISLEAYLIFYLLKRFPNNNFYSLNKIILGKFIGTFVNLFYLIYSLLIVIVQLTFCIDEIYNIAFRKTPIVIVIILFLSTAVYISTKDIIAIARISEIGFFVFLFVNIMFILVGFETDIDNLMPIGSNGIYNIMNGIIPALNKFISIYILLFIMPYITNNSKALKTTLAGIAFSSLISIIYFILIIGFFGQGRVKMFPYPLLKYINKIKTPIFERIDVLIMILWMNVGLISIFISFFIAKEGIIEIFFSRRKVNNYIIIGIVFFICVYSIMIIPNYYYAMLLNKIITLLSIAANLIFPLLLLTFSLLFKRRESS